MYVKHAVGNMMKQLVCQMLVSNLEQLGKMFLLDSNALSVE